MLIESTTDDKARWDTLIGVRPLPDNRLPATRGPLELAEFGHARWPRARVRIAADAPAKTLTEPAYLSHSSDVADDLNDLLDKGMQWRAKSRRALLFGQGGSLQMWTCEIGGCRNK